MALVRWQGSYKSLSATWLRWATLDGELLPNSEEIAAQERQRAEQAESQIRQIALNLLQQSMTIEQVARLTGLEISEIERLEQK